MIEYTCDEMVYLSCLHHLSVLVYFCRVYGEHLSNTQLWFGVVDFMWFISISSCDSICDWVACLIERFGGYHLDEGRFKSVDTHYVFFDI